VGLFALRYMLFCAPDRFASGRPFKLLGTW